MDDVENRRRFVDIIRANRVRPDDIDKSAAVFDIVQSSVEQCVRVSDNARERRTQLVRDVGNEILADLFQTLQIRNVVEDGNHSAAGGHGDRRRLHLEGARRVGGKMKPQLAGFAGGQHRADAFVERGIAHQLQQTKTLVAFAAESDGAQQSLVAERHFKVRIDCQNAFGHSHKNRFAPRGFEPQVADERPQLLSHTPEGPLERR